MVVRLTVAADASTSTEIRVRSASSVPIRFFLSLPNHGSGTAPRVFRPKAILAPSFDTNLSRVPSCLTMLSKIEVFSFSSYHFSATARAGPSDCTFQTTASARRPSAATAAGTIFLPSVSRGVESPSAYSVCAEKHLVLMIPTLPIEEFLPLPYLLLSILIPAGVRFSDVATVAVATELRM